MVMMAGPGHGLTDHPKALRDKSIVWDIGESIPNSPRRTPATDGGTICFGQSHVQGTCCASEDLKLPLLVKVLVGTRSGVVKWLEISGPACCALWVEVNDDGKEVLAPGLSTVLIGELKLVCRFRSRHALVQPLLGGISASQILMQKGIQQKLEAFISGSEWECPRNSLGNEDGKSFYCLRGKSCCSQGVGGTARIWQISSDHFKKLIDMLSPAGILRNFQEVVMQVVEISSFYDVPLQQLDLTELITRHPYVIFMDGSDLVVAWQGLQGFNWALLNFDFSSGIILAAKGKSFHDLRNYFKLQTADWSSSGLYGSNQADTCLTMRGRNSGVLHWKEWQRTSHCADCAQASALGSFLCDLFHRKEGNLSASEMAAARTLQHLHSLWGAGIQTLPVGAPIWELNTSRFCATGVGTREHHALLQLRSRDSLIRQNNLQILFELLPGLASHNGWDCSAASPADGSAPAFRQSKSNPVTFRSVACTKRWLAPTVHPRSGAWSEIEYGTCRNLLPLEAKSNISKLLLHGVMAAIRRRAKVFPEPSDEGVMEWLKVGSQTERSLRSGKLNWDRFNEVMSSRSVIGDDFMGSYLHKSSGTWRKLSEWVTHGFLEAILEQLRDSDHFSRWGPEAANACLKVVSTVPGEGSNRLVQSLLSIMKEKLDNSTGRQLRMAQTGVSDLVARPAKPFQGIPDNHGRGATQPEGQEVSWLDSMQCILQLLSSVTSGSSVIAAGLVQSRGLNLIIDTYNHLAQLSHAHSLRMKKEKGFRYERQRTHGPKSEASGDTLVTRDTLPPVKSREPVKQRTEVNGGQAMKQPFIEPYQQRSAVVQNEEKQSGRSCEVTSLHEDCIFEEVRGCKSATEGDSGDHHMLSKPLRPHIPQLSFSFLTRMDELSCASEMSSCSFINDPKESGYYLTDSMSESLSEFNAASRVRCNFHKLLCEAKCHALSTLSSMLSVSNRTVIPAFETTLPVDLDALAESLLAELLGGLSNDPACVGVGSHMLIYSTIFHWDRLYDTPAPDKVHDIKYESAGRKLSLVLLQLISKNLDSTITSKKEFMVTLRPLDSRPCGMSTNMLAEDSQSEASFWIDVGILFGILANFVTQWPERGAAYTVFKICGRQVSMVLDMLASSRCPPSWSISQVIAMQQILRLVIDAFQDGACCNNLSLQKCTEAEEFIWQLAVGSPQRWSCIERFANWLLLEACQSCTKNLVQTYYAYLQKPTACHLCKDEQASSLLMGDNLASNFQSWKKRLMKFLRVVIALIQRRLTAGRQVKLGHVSFPIPETMVWLLDFLMNPVKGILIRMLKVPSLQHMIQTPVTCQTHQQRDHQAQEKSPSNAVLGRDSSWKVAATSDRSNPCCDEQRSLDCGKDMVQDDNDMVASEDRCTRKILYDRNMECATRLSMTGHAKAGNPGGSHTGLCHTCKECGTITCHHNLVRQDALCLLADIFGLKLSAPSEKNSKPLVIGVTDRNPFLVGKYVDPFLENLFRSFLQLYNTSPHTENQTDHVVMLQMVTLKTKDTSPCTNRQSNYSQASVKTESMGVVGSVSRSPVSRLTKNEVLSTPASYRDEEVSHFCKLYGGVLLTLAQNQSEDLRKRFRQLHVMDFLIQQISLEYEACHFATPRHSSGAGVDISSKISRKMDYSDSEDTTILSRFRTEAKGHKKFSREQNEDQWKEMAAQIGPGKGTTHLGLDEHQNEGVQPSVFDQILGNSEFIFHEGERAHPSVSKAGPENGTPPQDRYLLNRKFPKGTASNTDDVEERQISQVKIPQLKLNLIAGNDVTRSKSPVRRYMDEGCPSGRSLNRVEGPRFGVGNQTEIDKPEAENKGKIASHKGPLGESEIGYQTENCSHDDNWLRAEGEASQSMTRDHVFVENRARTGTKDKEAFLNNEVLGTFRAVDRSKYTGRFCDFNEEVDRELAEEDITRSADEGEDGGKAEEDYFDSCSSSHDADREGKSQGHQIRPTVPKLNLVKSFRKDWNNRPDSAVLAKDTMGESASLGHEDSCTEGISGCGTYGSCAKCSTFSYETGRTKRRIYRDTDLHVLLLELFVSLMLTPYGTLDAYYSDRFPMEKSKLNAPFYLSYHLNHPANSHVLPSLKKRTREYAPSAYQILKLTCTALSNLALYARQERIARGAFAQIYTALVCRQIGGVGRENLVVLKTVDLPKGPHDPCKFFDIYSEVQILSKFLGQPKVCQVLDYGVDCDSYVLVLKHYKCSLRAWREQHTGQAATCYSSHANLHQRRLAGMNFLDRLPLYLEIYAEVLNAVKVLELQNVVHYDLKCDNILLEPSDSSLSAEDFWNPVWPPADLLHTLPFNVCIADFGQSKASINQGGECTYRNRGTEYVRSPEMLKLLSSSSQVDVQLELQDTVGKAVDVWGLGCLLYELLTGEYLLYDEDWIQFFIRVTMSSEELITEEKAAKVENCQPIMHFLQFALVRDPLKRPSLDDLITRLKLLQMAFPVQGVGSLQLHNRDSISQSRVRLQNLQQVESPSVGPVAQTREARLWISRIIDFFLCRWRSCSGT